MKEYKAVNGGWNMAGNAWKMLALAVFLIFMLAIPAAPALAADESWVKNPGLTNASIFLFIKVDYWNTQSSEWESEFTALDDDASRYLQGNSSYIALDQFFNGKYDTSENFTHGHGTYRVYAAVTDPDNNVLQNLDGSYLEASYNFTIDNAVPEHSAPLLNATDNPLNRTKANITCYNQSTTDPNNDFVVNSYSWYKNGVLNAAMPKKNDDGLVLYLPFNNNDSSTTRDYGLNNGGLIHSSTWTSNGKISGAYDFDGANSYINVSDSASLDIVSEITIGAWVKFDGIKDQMIVDKEGAYRFVFDNYGNEVWNNIVFEVWNGSAWQQTLVTTSWEKDKWYHLIGRYNHTHVALYRDGSAIGTPTAYTGDISVSGSKLLIGKYLYGGYDFNGTIDEVAIYNRSLSSDEIFAQYQAGRFTHSNDYSVINASETTKGDSWICEVTPMDRASQGSSINSTALTIQNTPPPKVTLVAPADDSFGYEFRPTFNWSAVVDDDGDDVTYRLHLVRTGCYGLSACQNPDVDVEGISGTSYAITEDLDLDSPYNWTVTGNDSSGYGEESDIWNYTVMSLIDISLVQDNIAVGGLEPGDNVSTEDDSPLPLIVQNNGNVHINLTVYASVQLWDLAPLGTKYFMFKAGDSATKPSSFNMTLSASDWVNMTNSSQFIVAELDYDDSTDYAEVEIAVEVPENEPPGTKSTSIIIEAIGTKV